MALATYDDLVSAVTDWLARNSDGTLSARAGDFVALCEDRVHNGNGEPSDPDYTPPLRIRAMEDRALDTDVSSAYIALPTGFLQMRRLQLNTDPVTPLKQVAPEYLANVDDSTVAGLPKLFAIVNNEIQLERTPDQTYTAEMVYWKKFTGLSSDNTTNWLLTNAPGVYLNGTLAEAAQFLGNWEAFARYDARYRSGIKGLQNSDNRGTWSGSLPTTQVVGMSTP